MESTYWEIEVELPAESEEFWGLYCQDQGAAGSQVTEDGPQQVIIRYFWLEAAPPPVDEWVRDFTARYPRLPPPVRWQTTSRPVEDWATSWKEHFKPLTVGKRLMVCPPWSAGEAGFDPRGRQILVIDPGQGFGTGSHATTALALEMVESALILQPPPARFLDVGCGSGILAIAARLLGVTGDICAVDNDCGVMEDVRRNFKLNGLRPPLLACCGPEAVNGPFQMITANIIAPVLLALQPALTRLAAPGAALVLSGILSFQTGEVLAAYRDGGWSLKEQRESELAEGGDHWHALLLENTRNPIR